MRSIRIRNRGSLLTPNKHGNGASAHPGYHARVNLTLRGRVQSVLVGVATAIVIVTIAIVPFLTPPWLAFEQDRAQATAWTGYTTEDLRAATDAIVADLVFGPPDFDVTVAGEPVLGERERSHMRDVRTIFIGLWALTAVALVVLVATAATAGTRRDRLYRAMSRGAATLGIGVVIVGIIAAAAFEPLFELFHRLFFAGGSYTFDPATERLVQLFPFTFWQETTIAVGVVIVVLAAMTWWLAGRRAPPVVGARSPNPAVTA